MAESIDFQSNILVVEDDPNLGSIIIEHLKMNGFLPQLVVTGPAALTYLEASSAELVLLDVMLPEMDGFTVARLLRERGDDVPIIFLTAKAMRDDRIEGFKAGADDYVTKPFSMEELLLRMQAVLRRARPGESGKSQPTTFQFGQFSFDPNRMILSIDGEQQKLTAREAEVLAILCRNLNQTVDRGKILRDVWGNDSYFNGRSMDVFVSRLRRYLKADPTIEILSLHGKGLRLVANERR